MSTNGGNGTAAARDLWKYIATVCVTIMITGSPGLLYALRTWNLQARVDLIQQRQDDVRERLARLEAEFQADDVTRQQLREEIAAIRAQLGQRTVP